MTIKAGASQGSNSMTIQSTAASGVLKPSNSSSLGIPPGYGGNVIGDDIVKVGESAVSAYLNPDLQAVISSLGFSSTRPEILAAFEFLPLLDESVIKSTGTNDTSTSIATTGAAELVDLHMQLKQLRYSEVLEFLKGQLGIQTASFGIGKKLDAATDDNDLLADFQSKMDDAKNIVDTLTTIYNAITPVLEAMQIKTNDYRQSSYAIGSNTGAISISVTSATSASGITTGSPGTFPRFPLESSTGKPSSATGRVSHALSNDRYNDDWIQPSVIGDLGLHDFVTQALGKPDDFWKNSPGTTILSQLIADIALRMFYPIQSYSSHTSKDTSFISNNGRISGASSIPVELLDIKAALSSLSKLSPHNSFTGGKIANLMTFSESSIAHTRDFSRKDFNRLWDIFLISEDPGHIGKACYMAASDFMMLGSVKSGKLKDFIDGISASDDGDKILERILGIDVNFSSKNIADILSPDSKSGLGSMLPPNDDVTNGGKVAPFEYSSTSLPSGQYSFRTGKSYFIDDLLTDNMNSIKTRLSNFADSINLTQNRLLGISEIMKQTDSGKSLGPFNLINQFLVQCSGAMQSDTAHMQNDNDNVWCIHSVAMMSLKDQDVAWLLFKYMVSLDRMRIQAGGWDDHFENLSSEIAERLIDCWPGFQGATNQANKDTWTESFYHRGNGAFSATDGFTTFLGSGESWSIDEIKGSFMWLYKILKDRPARYALNAPTFAAESFIGSIIWQYEIPVISAADRTPMLGIDQTGLAAIGFFIQMMMWNNMQWMQIPPDVNSKTIAASIASTGNVGFTSGFDLSSVQAAPSAELWKHIDYDPDSRSYTTQHGKGTWGDPEVTLHHVKRGGNTYFWSTRSVDSLDKAIDYLSADKSRPEIADELAKKRFDLKTVAGDWDGKNGYREEIDAWISVFEDLYWEPIEIESSLWGSLWYANRILQKMNDAISNLLSTLEGNNITSSTFQDTFDSIVEDEDLSRLLFLSLTRDSVSLSHALYDSLNEANRIYPYIPSTKAVMINQVKNLATMSSLKELVEDNSAGRKRILAIGLPAGFMDGLRETAIDSGRGLDYYKSTIISIKVWRRNMVDDNETVIPREFKFDISKFIIEGRATSPATGTSSIDAAQKYSNGQSVNDVLANTVVTTYMPEKQYTTIGGAYALDSNNSTSIGTHVFENLVISHYLKLYLKVTTGFDISEEIFPMQMGKIYFDGPDSDKIDVFDDLKSKLEASFPTKDTTSAINFDRLLGELTRSILLSPQKWANRVFYPKTFDRVVCVLVDEDDFEIDTGAGSNTGDSIKGYNLDYVVDLTTGDMNYSNAAQETVAKAEAGRQKPTYYQFYVTATILPAIDDVENASYAGDTALKLKVKPKVTTGYSPIGGKSSGLIKQF